jgi:hypothetical protein
VGSGRLAALPMGGFPIFFGAVLIVSLGTALSPVGARLATLPLAALVGFQAPMRSSVRCASAPLSDMSC